MFSKSVSSFLLLFLLLFLGGAPVRAQQHRATRLGNPATRFANPLQTPQDLQNLLRSEALRADVDYIARACGYQGDLDDLRRAATPNNILPLRIPVGTRLPAMSSRKKGRPVLMRDVLWAGQEPIDAYQFYFTSKGRRYRVVAPKACANFWVEARELIPKPARVVPPAVLLEVIDTKDPVEVGENEIYEIRVFNQGSVPLTNLRLACTVGNAQQFIPVAGTTIDQIPNSSILEKVSVLYPKAQATWRVPIKTLAAGDVRFVTELTCDQFRKPIRETEATQQY